jgi:histidinol-phosphatase (PHP family)
VTLPADSHVHTEWSWDAPAGSMQRSCERALQLGIPVLAFTEHVDHTIWNVAMDDLDPDDHLAKLAAGGRLTPPEFDAAGYLAAIEEYRQRYPQLRILSGLELGEPHWHAEAVEKVLAVGAFDRVLGSMHCLPDPGGYAEPTGLYGHRDPSEVVRSYLAEVAVLVSSSQLFDVLAHIDYPVRSWPESAGRFDPYDFEEEFRHALRLTAESGRALEMNTQVPLSAPVLQWWHDEGGQAVTFGSDAHDPERIAHGFRDATQLAEAIGFRPGDNPVDLWGRVD